MIDDLTSLSLSRTNTNIDEKDEDWDEGPHEHRSSHSSSFGLPASKDKVEDRGEIYRDNASSAPKEPSHPFNPRQQSPAPLPLEESDSESTTYHPSLAVRPRDAFTYDEDSEISSDETEDEDWSDEGGMLHFAGDETEDEDWSDKGGMLHFITERNTERNARIVAVQGMGEADGDGNVDAGIDSLGEGENVIVPPLPPRFGPFTLDRSRLSRVKRSALKKGKPSHPEVLPLITSRPVFQRDRCTIMITQGQPRLSARRKRSYMAASDLSDESSYAIEWGIRTMLRDGDELLIVTVVENEDKVDPPTPGPNPADRARSQPERQGVAYILVRQATSLLQQTRLHVTVSCQAWHAKNARHMLLDIVDHNNLATVIIGSRGPSQPNEIPLGSTSHYLIQRCSVPVIVVPQTILVHLTKYGVHVPLEEAAFGRGFPGMDNYVAALHDEMQHDGDWMDSADSENEWDGDRDEDGDRDGDGDGGEQS